MKMIFLLIALTSCYKLAPEKDEIRTVPTTNNPNILPGPQRGSPLPNMG